MTQSTKTEKIYAKLFSVIHEMPPVEKTRSSGGSFKYKYADLDSVINKAKPVLLKHGLGFTQSIGNVDGKQSLTTRVFSNEGEWIEDTTILPHAKLNGGNEAQEMGSSITYIRRYSLCSMLGIVSDDDTDGVIPMQKKDLTGAINNLRNLYSYLNDDMRARAESHIQNGNEKGIIDATNYAMKIKSDVDKGL